MEYCARFIGYGAYIVNRREHMHGMLDFVTGDVRLDACGGYVQVPNRGELSHFVATLPAHFDELNNKRKRSREWQFGESTINLDRYVDPRIVVGRFTARFRQIEAVLEQAESIGLRIRRRPYSEYIDEVLKTGTMRVEIHGIGLFNNDKLVAFDPRKSSACVVPGTCRVYFEDSSEGHPSGSPDAIKSLKAASQAAALAEFAVLVLSPYLGDLPDHRPANARLVESGGR